MFMRSRTIDSAVAIAAWLTALGVIMAFVWLVSDVVMTGLPRLSWNFLWGSPLDAGRAGGILPMLVSTLWILAVCLLVCVPLGLATALSMSELLPRHSVTRRWLGAGLDILSGVPSIVFGLFGYAVFANRLGLGFSILSGGLTLACMVLPLFTRIAEQALAATPPAHRLAAQALGVSTSGWMVRVLLPGAMPGIAAGLVLSIGRALAETAALIFTSGYVMRMPQSVFDSGRALSVHIYDLSMNVPGGNGNAAATALVLLLLLVVINLLASRFMRLKLR